MIPINADGKEFWIHFAHNRLEGADVRRVPTYDELVDALVCAGYGFRSNQFKETGVLAVRAVLDRVKHAETPSHCTVCKITKKIGPTQRVELASGFAFTSKGDNFCKQTGRWYSMTRALEELIELPEGEKPRAGHVLQAYFSRPRGSGFSWQRAAGPLEAAAFTKWYLTEYKPKIDAGFGLVFKESLRDAA